EFDPKPVPKYNLSSSSSSQFEDIETYVDEDEDEYVPVVTY
ncbi:18456_t:CDS:2, partial [Racocetra persica]